MELQIGQEMYALIKKLYPICRSITGNGVRQTLNAIKEHIPFNIREVATGTKVFDWTVPKEWNIRDAYIKDPYGKKIVDFKKSNLHVLGYSTPIHRKVTLKELKKHLYTLPGNPDWIPYITSYYQENWGFCLSHKQYKQLKNGIYEVFIDSSLEKGSLTYGELYLEGQKKDEFLFSTYVCHPSLCNDNLSGVVTTTFLAKQLKKMKLKYSYRFLFIPETIGAITWLSRNESKASKIKFGLALTCIGDSGNITYKRSRDGNSIIDKAVEKVLFDSRDKYEIVSFNPADGSDERQFCSPGFNLPIGSLMRTPYGHFSQYHTSADNLKIMSPLNLADSFRKCLEVISVIENNDKFLNNNPKCEPQLGRRGLYRTIGKRGLTINDAAIYWVLNYSDGTNSLLDIALRSGIKFQQIKEASNALVSKKLIKIIK